MDVITNIRAFLTVARLGSFSGAAREASTVPSVISKRISHLEHTLKAQLFLRSTRGLMLTEAGHDYQQRFIAVLAELDAAINGAASSNHPQERVRIKCPATMAPLGIGDIMVAFRLANPGIRVDLVQVDRTVNPLEEGFDLAIGALPAAYPHVVDVPLCPLPRRIVASPGYLDRMGRPEHPRELAAHQCMTLPISGTRWTFEGPAGEVVVDVGSVFSSTDSAILRDAAIADVGVCIVASYSVEPFLRSGELEEILPGFRVPELFLKVLVPETRLASPTIRAVIEALKAGFQPRPPWER